MHLGGKFERLIRVLIVPVILLTGLFTFSSLSHAGDGDLSVQGSGSKLSVSPNSKSADPDDLASYIFVEDRITLEFMTGAMFSPCGIGPVVPVYNYQQNNVRLGWMLDSPDSWGPQAGIDDPLRGNFEAVLEATGSYVWYSFGTYMVGVTGLVRYNFVQPNWIVVPYIQGGAGVVYTNGRNWSNQDAIGANVEFTPQFAGGLKFLLEKNWTFNIEGAFQHISNANTSARNQGVNAYGGFVGFTYVFDKIWSD
jgi:lipid A 3-O-deacylase